MFWTGQSRDRESAGKHVSDTAFGRMTEVKRNSLVGAAAEEFAAHPFDQASLNRIITSCRMSKSSFYYVVDSKESLLTLVVDELRKRAAEDWAPPVPADFAADFWETAASVFDDALHVWPTSRALELLWRIVHANRGNTAVRSLADSYSDWIAEVVATGRKAGAVDEQCPVQLQVVTVSSLLLAFDEWALHNVAAADPDDQGLSSEGSDGFRIAAEHQFRLLRRLLEA